MLNRALPILQDGHRSSAPCSTACVTRCATCRKRAPQRPLDGWNDAAYSPPFFASSSIFFLTK